MPKTKKRGDKAKPKKQKQEILSVGIQEPGDFDPAEIEALIGDVGGESKKLKLTIYGRPGVGKTRLSATFPKALLLDVNEDGTLSIREYKGKVKRIQLTDFNKIEGIYWYLATQSHPYETLIVDTITELHWLGLRNEVEEDDGTNAKSIKMPSLRNRGNATELLRVWITNLKNLPMNVVFIAQEASESEDDEYTAKTIDLSPKVRSRLTAACDIIGRLYVREGKNGKPVRCLYVGPHEYWLTKDRSGSLGEELLSPTYDKIMEKINK